LVVHGAAGGMGIALTQLATRVLFRVAMIDAVDDATPAKVFATKAEMITCSPTCPRS
jgi:NADPH:quinone reductase-like Zn-dependent oxidoreductase